MAPPSDSERRYNSGSRGQGNTARSQLLVAAWNKNQASLILQVMNNDNIEIRPVVYYPRHGENPIPHGKIMYGMIEKRFSYKKNCWEIVAKYLEEPRGSPRPLTMEFLISKDLIPDKRQPRPERQPRGPPPSYDNKSDNKGFTRKNDRKKMEESQGETVENPVNPSGDAAAAAPPLSPSCNLPSRTENESSPLPKKINVSTDDASEVPCIQAYNIFAVEAIVAESEKTKAISFIEDGGCTCFGSFENDAEFVDAMGNSSKLTPAEIKDRLQMGQKVLADVRVCKGNCKVITVRMIPESARTDPEPEPQNTSDLIDLESIKGSEEPSAAVNLDKVEGQFQDAEEAPDVTQVPAVPQPQITEEVSAVPQPPVAEETPAPPEPIADVLPAVSQPQVAEEILALPEPIADDAPVVPQPRVTEEVRTQPVRSNAEEHVADTQPEVAKEEITGEELPKFKIPENAVYDHEASHYWVPTGHYFDEKQGYWDETACMYTGDVMPPLPEADETTEPDQLGTQPTATEEELRDVIKTEERLASVFSCNEHIKTLNDSGVQMEDVGESCVNRKPSAAMNPMEPIKEEPNAKQIARLAAMDAVGLFMKKFLKYDEMAVAALLEGFEKNLLSSVTDNY